MQQTITERIRRQDAPTAPPDPLREISELRDLARFVDADDSILAAIDDLDALARALPELAGPDARFVIEDSDDPTPITLADFIAANEGHDDIIADVLTLAVGESTLAHLSHVRRVS